MFEKSPKFILSVDNINGQKEQVDFTSFGEENKFSLSEEEGQLVVDVAQTKDNLLVIATMSGTKPNQIELHLHNDLLTIRGKREPDIPFGAEYILKESYWGKFSRTIVLPTEVKVELAKAEYKNGVLIIYLPKATTDKDIPIYVVEE